MIDTQTKTYNKPKSDTCHCSDPKPGGACCNLVCFERPNYFCGHLLTDTDLSTEQRYAIEKRKLQNRTLHGWGVVCGLRLTCDEQCGGIIIDEGYAIDDCGNDLVVCQPLRFDVLAKLKEKGYLAGDAAYDPCKPKDKQDDCKIRQCFYITICYEEEPHEFTTPFVAGCRPSLTECEPTRIREGVRFEVLSELPEESDWLKRLECRIQNCWGLFAEGSFSGALTKHKRKIAMVEEGRAEPDGGWWDLFCELRGFLLLYLSKHPDKYNCTLEDDIREIAFPQVQYYQTRTAYDEGESREDRGYRGESYSQDVRAAFCRLFELANQHVVSCILGEMIFPCPEPPETSCIVLGTIEVVGDRIVHVCNCPRSYVLSFASFWEVIVATVLGGVACEETPETKVAYGRDSAGTATPRGRVDAHSHKVDGEQWTTRYNRDEGCEDAKRICCSPAKFDCHDFIPRLAKPETIYDGSTAALRMLSELQKSVRRALDFTRPETLSANTFLGMRVGKACELAERLSADLQIHEEPLPDLEPDQVMRAYTLGGPERTIHAFRSGDRIVDVRAEWREEGLLDPADRAEIYKRIEDAEQQAKDAMQAVEDLRGLVKPYGRFKRQVSETVAETEKPASKKRPTRRRGLGTSEEGENG